MALTIYDIKYQTQQKSPHYFDRKTMSFFGQTMRDFKVVNSQSGRVFIIASGKHGTISLREFKDNDLLNVTLPDNLQWSRRIYDIIMWLKWQ